MLEVFAFSELQVMAFVLIFLRMCAFIIAAPLFGVQNVPLQLRILFALCLSLLIFPIIKWQNLNNTLMSSEIFWLAGKEIFIGLVLGFLSKLFFFAIGAAGMLIGLSMGLASAQVFNPALGSHGNVIEEYKITVATLFFLAINGHHLLLAGLVESFNYVPLSLAGLNLLVFRDIAAVGQDILLVAVKISSPILVAVLLMNIAMGILGRAVPQINVLITSWPLNILLGFGILVICLPMFLDQMRLTLNTMTLFLFTTMKAL